MESGTYGRRGKAWEPIHKTIPDSKLVLIPDVGHMVDMQAPDRCNAEIRSFLDTVEQDRPE